MNEHFAAWRTNAAASLRKLKPGFNLLAKIGITDSRAVRVLKRRARSGAELAFHDTIAHAMLGEGEFLHSLEETAKSRDVAIQGISSLYSNAVNDCPKPWRLDYHLMERLLAPPGCKESQKNFQWHL